jgi:thymidylate synthase
MNKFTSLHELFLSELQALSGFGNEVSSNNSNQTELLFRSFELTDPTNIDIGYPSRKFNINYAVMEFLWYLSRNRNVENIGKCANIWLRIQDGQKEVESNYGTFILGEQWDWIKSELKKDKDSRRCTIVIGQPYHKTKNWHDIPCTQYMQVFIRDNKLHLGVNMRSNDIIFGLCNDIFNFALFQQLMLNELREIYPDLELGSYYHNAGSLHLYEMHYEMREHILMDATVFVNDIKNHIIPDKKYVLRPEITIDYIDREKIFLPREDMPKQELIEFTDKQMEKLFI